MTIAGYPAGFSGEQMTTAQVSLDPAAADLDYPNGTVMPGNSGGPLIDSNGDVVGVVSTTGAASQLTPADSSWINSWMNETQANENFFVAENGSSGGLVAGSLLPAGGPMNLTTEYTWSGPNGAAIFAMNPNSFLVSTTGNSVLTAKGGNNVLAALTGSNILVGGTGIDGGRDTFFATTADGGGWTDIVNLHSGDELTVWDYDPNSSSYSWLENQGVPGLTGATLVTAASPFRSPEAVTFAGMSVAQAKSALSLSTGIDPSTGRSYLLVTDHG